MRAVFTLDLPEKVPGEYPDDPEILKLVRGFGWEPRRLELLEEKDIKAMLAAQGSSTDEREPTPRDIGHETFIRSAGQASSSQGGEPDEAARTGHYKRLSAPLFEEMPEVAAAEWNYVIFLGYVSDNQTLFVVTRMVPGQITFRLLHRELPRLQSSTEKMIRKILSARLEKLPLHIADPTVTVYERRFDHVILTGRVITQPFKETRRINLKDLLLTIVSVGLFVPTAYVVMSRPPTPGVAPTFLHATLDRGSTALLTAALVSVLGFVHTWIQVRRTRLAPI
jgi:hypothetical protein